ncbi:MAG TPA: nicotinate phosphoribosyltransferase [Kofleriaceae bacterium]|nr:nicotinate phosphoribosyltransferase [Kofleriaceae bacterium]
MGALRQLYRPSLALCTDLYQLTMAYGYFAAGMAHREVSFHLSFRTNPFGGGYAIACGLGPVIEYLSELRFADADLAYLATLAGGDGKPLFPRPFLEALAAFELSVDVDAIVEGSVVFGHEPLIRVTGPAIECQLLETALLNLVNFPTLVATKAARICQAANGDPVLEFGLRRAQGIDGGLSAARAAYIGGCAATSNVLAGQLFGLPVKGTHAHSWVMMFADEVAAFSAYAEAMPQNCVFLVDTYDTLRGVEHAITVGKTLRTRGFELAGIRLDSGDLAHLATGARALLDAAGFEGTAIVASNDLDEHLVTSLKQQGAPITVWGIGTRLVTAFEQPALDGVYKLSAIRSGDHWRGTVKVSEQTAKVSTPGLLQVRRFEHGGQMVADMIYDLSDAQSSSAATHTIDVHDPTRHWLLPAKGTVTDLLIPIFRGGRPVYEAPPLPEVRAHAAASLATLSPRVKRFANPQIYAVGLEPALAARKLALIDDARGGGPKGAS